MPRVIPGSLPSVRRGVASPKVYFIFDVQGQAYTVAYTRPDALRLISKMPDGSYIYMSQLGIRQTGYWVKRDGALHYTDTEPGDSLKSTFYENARRRERAHPQVDLAAMDDRDNRELVLRFGGPLRTARARHKRYMKLLDAYMQRHPHARLSDELAQALERQAGAKPTYENARRVKRTRRNPSVTVLRRNPVANRTAAVLSTRAVALSYLHAESAPGSRKGQAYIHKFRKGVSVQLLSDGSVRLFRPDRKSLWRKFKD